MKAALVEGILTNDREGWGEEYVGEVGAVAESAIADRGEVGGVGEVDGEKKIAFEERGEAPVAVVEGGADVDDRWVNYGEIGRGCG